MKFGKVLRELRGSRTRKDVARSIDCTEMHLYNLELDKGYPSFPLLARLADAYGVAVWQIVQQAEMTSDD